MSQDLDDAIMEHLLKGTEGTRRDMHAAFLNAAVLVPMTGKPTEVRPGVKDIPVVFLQSDAGISLPVFTSEAHLLEWRPAGCEYAQMKGRELVKLAKDNPQISRIRINHKGQYNAVLQRGDFDALLAEK